MRAPVAPAAFINPVAHIIRVLCVLCCLCVGMSSCAYRIAMPYQLSQDISVAIVGNDAQLVRGQLSIHRHTKQAIVQDLGWTIGHGSVHNLRIHINEDTMEEAAHNADRISTRWTITLHSRVTFTSPALIAGSAHKTFESSAGVSSLAGEVAAIDSAGVAMGDQISAWLVNLPYKPQ